ncbi:MAG: Omp28-related outer membrane protein [Bacteroidetes bacterium]|nr:Omp28-related outer membrane protein [Bacteroidota bacterium]
MKLRNLIWVGIAALMFTACKEDEGVKKTDDTNNTENTDNTPAPIVVSETNMSIINKMTATWCGPCGAWGWTLFEEIIAATENDAVEMGTYGDKNSNYYNATSQAFKTAQAPSAGWPAFCVNGYNKTEYASNGGIYTTTTKTNVLTEVSRFKAAECVVSAGYRDTIIDGKIKIDVKTKFFKDGEEAYNYYVGAYVIEDKVVGYQNSIGNNASHHHVLRSSMTGDNVWGVAVGNGKAAGSEFDTSFEMAVDPSWNTENLEYAVIIWKNIGPKYMFVNAHQNKD